MASVIPLEAGAGAPLDGILLVDKPAGPSSHGIVAAIRRALDPFATGLMVVLVGRATRAAQFLVGLDKRYETLAQLGATSTTGDPEGEITQTGRVPASPLTLPQGDVRQRPPAYSAIKIDGERAYRRARRGEEVEVPERTVTVHDFREVQRQGDQVWLALHCSSGTYVRSLVADLHDGYCLELRRTAIGPFSIEHAATLDALATASDVRSRLQPLHTALAFLPSFELDPEQAERIRTGRRVAAADLAGAPVPPNTPLLLCDAAGAVAAGRSDGVHVSTVVGFRP